MHDGCNARAWVARRRRRGSAPTASRSRGRSAPDRAVPDATTAARRRQTADRAALAARPERLRDAVRDSTLCARAQRDSTSTPGATSECCLPAGRDARDARRPRPEPALAVGDVLVLRGGARPDAPATRPTPTRAHRHAVRLTRSRRRHDASTRAADGRCRCVEIDWGADDALPFALCLSRTDRRLGRQRRRQRRARQRRARRPRPTMPSRSASRSAATRCRLGVRRASREALVPAAPRAGSRGVAAASGATTTTALVERRRGSRDPERRPARCGAARRRRVRRDDASAGSPQRDLLGSDRFAHRVRRRGRGRRHRPTLRFGDDVHGAAPDDRRRVRRRPTASATAAAGNVGADAILHLVTSRRSARRSTRVRNPLPADGGTDPEPLERVRLDAPQAFRIAGARGHAEADYADGRRAGIPECSARGARCAGPAAGTRSFVTVDRPGGAPLDRRRSRADLRAFLERYRMAGHDLEIDAAAFVPLDIAARVCVKPGYFRSDVERRCSTVLGSRALAGRHARLLPSRTTSPSASRSTSARSSPRRWRSPGVEWVQVDDLPALRQATGGTELGTTACSASAGSRSRGSTTTRTSRRTARLAAHD